MRSPSADRRARTAGSLLVLAALPAALPAALGAQARLADGRVAPAAPAVAPAPAPAAPAAAAPAPRPAAAPARPAYQSLRFEERWPAAPRAAGGDPFDALKHVPLSPGGAVHLTVGGQLRWRAEGVSHFQLGAGEERRDAFTLTRTDVAADLQLGGHARVFGELRDAVARSRQLPGGARPQDSDRWDVQNLFGELAAGPRLRGARLRAGRQELSVGRERLIATADWSNARRSYDGVRFDVRPTASTSLLLLRVRPVSLSASHPNRSDSTALVWGGVATREARGRATVQLLGVQLEQPRATLATASGSKVGAHRRSTFGARVAGATPGAAWLTYEAEGAGQRGTIAGAPVRAWFVVNELTATAAALPTRPALTLGYDRLSGTRDSTAGVAGTFNPLYQAPHSFSGYADVVGRSNLVDLRAVLAAQAPVLGQLRLAVHGFDRASLQDGAYTKAGGVLRRPGGDRTRHLGREFDATTSRPLGRHVRLVAGYGHFTPGGFLRHAPGGAHAVDWGFGGTTFTF